MINGIPHINLYYTNLVNDDIAQHDCLRIESSIKHGDINRQIISYCMSELSSKFNIENMTKSIPKLTFAELSKQNISSEQLYYWSTPIDIIERYQLYLNKLSISNEFNLGKEIFYNCTLPRFGPQCQYELYSYYENALSLYDIIKNFYHSYEYKSKELTCYIHLKCDRGHSLLCLDWSDICDGKIDCLNDGIDEKNCWLFDFNECKDNEYQCANGQCIPKLFYQDDKNVFDCLDGSDEFPLISDQRPQCSQHEPSFECEDIICDYSFLTSSCKINRGYQLLKIMSIEKDTSVSDECWTAFICIIKMLESKHIFISEFDEIITCNDTIIEMCPLMINYPNIPVLFGHIYSAYTKNDIKMLANENVRYPYLCYNNSRYDDYFVNAESILFKNLTCFRHPMMFIPSTSYAVWFVSYKRFMNIIENDLRRYTLVINYTSEICNRSNVYQCINSSKCISIYRFMNGKYDCPYKDDEDFNRITNNDLIEQIKQKLFKCEKTNKYISRSKIKNGICDCEPNEYEWCEDENLDLNYIKRNISFQTICDGFIELESININGENQTDETECQQWECNNIYTHCNNIWNCPNVEDETNCYLPSSLNYSSNSYVCISPNENQFIQISIKKLNDGKVDCLGGIDEPNLCGLYTLTYYDAIFYCKNSTSQSCIYSFSLCNGIDDCEHGDDEQFCDKNRTFPIYGEICSSSVIRYQSELEKLICNHLNHKPKQKIVSFSLNEINKLIDKPEELTLNIIYPNSSINKIPSVYEPRCHRGLDLRVWLNNENNLTERTCLCPPSYYGSKCQYQNERISLTMKFRALSDSWQTLFSIIILLIDNSNEKIIHSYEQFSYLSIRDCKIKYHIYLFYSTRPKDQTKNYSIHIDIYEKISLNYRGSLLFPIYFSFLPIHRLTFIIDIPPNDNKLQSCSNDQCNYGKCIKYSNTQQNLTFCQCLQGWSGKYCNISYNNTCSLYSLSIGISASNQSICICSINKFGSRCFINTICENNNNNNNSICENNGQCISNDEYMITNETFICICPKGFSGKHCEIVDKKIILIFEKDSIPSQSIFIHFIEVIKNDIPIRITTFQTIPLTQNSITINWSKPFHLMFIELINKTYYLPIIEKDYNQSIKIIKIFNSSDRCPHINELFNKTFIEWHLIRRIKYYHIPCQNLSLNLSCFYDDIHLCLCYNYNQKRLSNCFNFNHNMKFDCLGQSVCQNNAQCFQDNSYCPQRSICICHLCYYGRQCQFSTSGFGLSLDAILGYHIIQHQNIKYQPFIIIFSLILTIIFIILGFINGILALITFKNKIVCEVGCGLYLLGSSITTLFIIILFGLKFSILILTQMTIISNELFLKIQCISLDFLLQVCLNMDQWLNACVATERAITTIKGVKFVKRKSKKAAKLIIPIIFIIIIGTFIYDPIYRNIIIEENNDDYQKRIWCIITYSSNLKIFNTFIHTFHFLTPFIINLISIIILITKRSQQQSIVQTHRTFKEHLREQFHQHKHLLTGPIVLVILALPRLIITYISKCMKSVNDSWLFLIIYFISFIPSMITFIIFILPSKFYKKEFHKSIVQYRTILKRRLHLTL